MRNYLILLLSSFFFIYGCGPSKRVAAVKDDGILEITFVQVNDVYEIAPLEGGKTGGIARLATLKKDELKKNPNTLMVLAGDFVSPSVFNSLRFEGKAIRGRQMVESLNEAGLDLAVFGNHEFDIKENELLDRINESTFGWISSNAFHKTANGIKPFAKKTASGEIPFPETYIMDFEDRDGTKARIGFFSVVLPFNRADYVYYEDPIETAEKMYNRIKDSCDAVIAITHLQVEEDSVLATRIPQLALIMGGHEHDMQFKKIGNTYITKAHANAKSAYINRFTINKKDGSTHVVPELKMIDESIALDSATDVVVHKWMQIGFDNYASLGFDAEKIVMSKGEPLEGRETEIRSGQTNLTKYVAEALKAAAPDAVAAIYNSGAIRVDDVLQMPVTQYDIIRSLPYGGVLVEVDMSGQLLKQVLESGRNNVGNGGFLQYSGALSHRNGEWKLNNESIVNDRTYRIAIADFLLTGGEANMDYLTEKNPGIIKVYPRATDKNDLKSDLRKAIISYMEGLGK